MTFLPVQLRTRSTSDPHGTLIRGILPDQKGGSSPSTKETWMTLMMLLCLPLKMWLQLSFLVSILFVLVFTNNGKQIFFDTFLDIPLLRKSIRTMRLATETLVCVVTILPLNAALERSWQPCWGMTVLWRNTCIPIPMTSSMLEDFLQLYPRKQQTEIFYWSCFEWWLVFGFQQVAMEDFYWMQSRSYHRFCESSWELSSIDNDRAFMPWLGFSCDRSEVREFYFPAWFEAFWSWYFAFHVWQRQWNWLHSKGARNKATSSLWNIQILHFEDNHVVERWLWIVFDFKWCCFVLWRHSLQIFWDRGWFPILGISFCKSNHWTWPTTWDQNWQLGPQHDSQRKVRGILAIRRDIPVLGKWPDCWVESSPFTFSKEKNNSVGIHGPRSSWEVPEVAQQLSKWQKKSRSLWWYAVWTTKLTNKWGR